MLGKFMLARIALVILLPTLIASAFAFRTPHVKPPEPVHAYSERTQVDSFSVRFGSHLPTRSVKTIPIRAAQYEEPPRRIVIPPVEEQLKPQPPPRTSRTKVVDICARHGMRRVDYGKRWRCRR